MVKPVRDQEEPAFGADHDPGVEPDVPLSDEALLELLDGLVNDRGRVPAARTLGVNYRTLANCCDSRQVSRRMRQALGDFRKAGDFGDAGTGVADHAVGQDDPESGQDDNRRVLEGRVAELEEKNRRLRETVAEQAHRLEELTRLAAAPEAIQDDAGDTGAGAVEEVTGDVQVDDLGPDWRPPRRRPGMPGAGVVTLEEQPDEEHAFGPGAPLVAEWRQLQNRDGQALSRVERAAVRVRRWELEARMLRDWQLTLPPETDPLDESRRNDHVRWREEALAEARRELGRAKQARLLRRVVTLGLWRK